MTEKPHSKATQDRAVEEPSNVFVQSNGRGWRPRRQPRLD